MLSDAVVVCAEVRGGEAPRPASMSNGRSDRPVSSMMAAASPPSSELERPGSKPESLPNCSRTSTKAVTCSIATPSAASGRTAPGAGRLPQRASSGRCRASAGSARALGRHWLDANPEERRQRILPHRTHDRTRRPRRDHLLRRRVGAIPILVVDPKILHGFVLLSRTRW